MFELKEETHRRRIFDLDEVRSEVDPSTGIAQMSQQISVPSLLDIS